MLVPAALFLLSKDDGSRIVNRDQQPPSLKSELQAPRRSKTFRFTVLGYAGYAASVIGFSTFGPSIGEEPSPRLGLWTDSVKASLAFSATLAVSGALGTPLGGLALDAWTRKRENKLKAALEVSIATVGAGALLITPAAFARDRRGSSRASAWARCRSSPRRRR